MPQVSVELQPEPEVGTHARHLREPQRRVGGALAHHHIGLDECDDGIWSVFFNTVLLAKLDERDLILRD